MADRIMVPKGVHILIPRNLEICYHAWHKVLYRKMKVKDLEIKRLS